MKQESPYASLPPRACRELRRLETQLGRDLRRPIVLLAYEAGAEPTPVFDDLQCSGPAENKRNIFMGEENLYGNITQWHI